MAYCNFDFHSTPSIIRSSIRKIHHHHWVWQEIHGVGVRATAGGIMNSRHYDRQRSTRAIKTRRFPSRDACAIFSDTFKSFPWLGLIFNWKSRFFFSPLSFWHLFYQPSLLGIFISRLNKKYLKNFGLVTNEFFMILLLEKSNCGSQRGRWRDKVKSYGFTCRKSDYLWVRCDN